MIQVSHSIPITLQSWHYNDVTMGTIASQITSLTIIYSIVYSDAVQRNIKAPRHWPLCGEFSGDRWIPRTNGQLRGKCFHLMTSSWNILGVSGLMWATYIFFKVTSQYNHELWLILGVHSTTHALRIATKEHLTRYFHLVWSAVLWITLVRLTHTNHSINTRVV